MLRNRDGINFDGGIPLVDSFEFENLYVPFHQEHFSDLLNWLKNQNTPLLIGGQIGSGKSTFINKALSDSESYPDFVFHFDQDAINIFDNNPLLIIVKEVISKAISEKLDLSFSSAPSELTKGKIRDWKELSDLISVKDYSFNTYKRKKDIALTFETNQDFILPILKEIISLYENKTDRKAFLFASGIDKYLTSTFDSFFLNTLSNFLSGFKTLFEVNAVHIFDNKWALKNCQKIFLTSLKKEQITDLFRKRMGIYAFSIDDVLDDLNLLSGGNLRQAIRLLTNFVTIKTNDKLNSISFLETVRKTSQDFFSFAVRPSSELMRHVFKEKSLSTTTITLPGDKDTAQRALYHNWIFIKGSSEVDKWDVDINPLVKHLFLDPKDIPDYETQMLRLYAQNQQISSFGLTFGDQSNSQNSIQEILNQPLTDSYIFNTADILKMISAALLSKNRSDRIIIAYHNVELIEATRNYIFAKANTFEYQSSYHVKIISSIGSPLDQILNTIDKHKVDIYSFDFKDDFENKDIEAIDKVRDVLLTYQMIWWVPIENLKKYLPLWTQLRQLFQTFILEDELLASINRDEIEEDIKYYSSLKSKPNTNISEVMNNLEKILFWLKESNENANE